MSLHQKYQKILEHHYTHPIKYRVPKSQLVLTEKYERMKKTLVCKWAGDDKRVYRAIKLTQKKKECILIERLERDLLGTIRWQVIDRPRSYLLNTLLQNIGMHTLEEGLWPID